MSFFNDVKKIDHRDWHRISSEWIGHLPSFSSPGVSPQAELADFFGLDDVAKKTFENPGQIYKGEVQGLRSEIFREGFFLFHKAVHVCSAGLTHVDTGVNSWGVSSAYHASFFAIKSMLCFLGLSFPKITTYTKCLMIDGFPELERLSKNQIKKGIKPIPEVKFVMFPNLTHQQWWAIFLRVIDVSKVDIWDNDIVLFLKSFDSSDFAFQRNSLHYKNNHWLIANDLFVRTILPQFGIRADLKTKLNSINQHTNDFSFILAYCLLYLTHILVKDLVEKAPVLKSEFQLVNDAIGSPTYARLHQTLQF